MKTGFDFADVIDEIVERAYGETTTAADIISARRSIYLVLESWHAQQMNTWRIKTQDFQVANGTVNLPASIDDVLTVTCVSQFSGGRETEVALTRISETEYANLTTKDTSGQPTQFMLRRTEPPAIRVHPRGRADRPSEKLRITYIARPANYDRTSQGSDDMPSRWLQPLIMSAALDLASKNPERAGMRLEILAANAPMILAVAQTNDRQRNSFRMRIG